jgi:hypothetical protein
LGKSRTIAAIIKMAAFLFKEGFMRIRRPFLIILLLVTAVLLFFLISRRSTRADFGPAAALCPGPDAYGYTCTSGEGFAYIDATTDSQLYEDEGTVPLALPFPFTFYGTSYLEIFAGSNGTLQFNKRMSSFANDCLGVQPAAGMGEMIAPYWDDLDLRFEGFLETETVGEAPNRIFVIEWDDVPRYGDNPDDRVTFAVQLFEGSHDILFLYEDVTTFEGHNGRNATVGLQSEANGLTLQYSCDQPALADSKRLYFPHPDEPNEAIEPRGTAVIGVTTLPPSAKGIVAELIDGLTLNGPAILPKLQNHWRSQNPPRAAEWRWQDLTGDGRSEFIMLWYGGRAHPELAQLVVLTSGEESEPKLLLDTTLSRRSMFVSEIIIAETADLTQDGLPDILLQDDQGQLRVLSVVNGEPILLTVPEQCQGGLILRAAAEGTHLDIIRDGCETEGRLIVRWDNNQSAFHSISAPGDYPTK